MNRKTKWIVVVAVLIIAALALSVRLFAGQSVTKGQPSSSPLASASPTISALGVSLSPAAIVTVAPFLQVTSTQPKITWSPTSSIEVILSPGESAAKDFTFTSDQALQNAVIESVPEIAGFLSIQPNTIASLPAGQSQPVHISIAIPAGTAFGTYNGTIHVRIGTQTLPQTVKVVVKVWNASINQQLGIRFLYPPSSTVQVISNARGTSVYLREESEEFPGEGITITKTARSITDILTEINSTNQLTAHAQQQYGLTIWDVYRFQEFGTGFQFIAAFAVLNGSLIEAGAKNNAFVASTLEDVLTTLRSL